MADEQKILRADATIAVSALLVSALAAIASVATAVVMVRQTDVIARQLSSTVWPYLSIEGQASASNTTITMTNNGLGPAIVRAIVVRLDGKPQKRFTNAILPMLAPAFASSHVKPPSGGHFGLKFSGTTAGEVLRPGEDIVLMRVDGTTIAPLIARQEGRLDVQACYCSLLNDCWTTSSSSQVNSRIGSCDIASKQSVESEDMQSLNASIRRLSR